jgi:hypothetical protein
MPSTLYWKARVPVQDPDIVNVRALTPAVGIDTAPPLLLMVPVPTKFGVVEELVPATQHPDEIVRMAPSEAVLLTSTVIGRFGFVSESETP